MAVAGIHNSVQWRLASSSVRKIEGHLVYHQAVREEGAAGSGWSRRQWKNPSKTAAVSVHVLSDYLQ